jgi:hypothetical protein
MAQGVSVRRLTTEARVHSQASLYEIYGGQSGIATGFSPSTFGFPVSTIPPMLHIRLHLVYMLFSRRTDDCRLGTFEKASVVRKLGSTVQKSILYRLERVNIL